MTQSNTLTLSTRTLALTVVALTVLLATLAIPASAGPADSAGPIQADTTDGGGFDFDIAEIRASVETFLERTNAAATGVLDRIEYEASAANPWADAYNVDAESNETITVINDNSEELAVYLNNHSVSSNLDTDSDQLHEIRLVDDASGEAATLFVEIEYDDDADTIDSIEATDELTGDAKPDAQHRVSGLLTQNFAEEVDLFVEEFAVTDKELSEDPSYHSRLASQYAGLSAHYFESTLLDDDFDGFDDGDDGSE